MAQVYRDINIFCGLSLATTKLFGDQVDVSSENNIGRLLVTFPDAFIDYRKVLIIKYVNVDNELITESYELTYDDVLESYVFLLERKFTYGDEAEIQFEARYPDDEVVIDPKILIFKFKQSLYSANLRVLDASEIPSYTVMLQNMVNEHAAVNASTLHTGHIKIDGHTIVISEDGVISTNTIPMEKDYRIMNVWDNEDKLYNMDATVDSDDNFHLVSPYYPVDNMFYLTDKNLTDRNNVNKVWTCLELDGGVNIADTPNIFAGVASISANHDNNAVIVVPCTNEDEKDEYDNLENGIARIEIIEDVPTVKTILFSDLLRTKDPKIFHTEFGELLVIKENISTDEFILDYRIKIYQITETTETTPTTTLLFTSADFHTSTTSEESYEDMSMLFNYMGGSGKTVGNYLFFSYLSVQELEDVDGFYLEFKINLIEGTGTTYSESTIHTYSPLRPVSNTYRDGKNANSYPLEAYSDFREGDIRLTLFMDTVGMTVNILFPSYTSDVSNLYKYYGVLNGYADTWNISYIDVFANDPDASLGYMNTLIMQGFSCEPYGSYGLIYYLSDGARVPSANSKYVLSQSGVLIIGNKFNAYGGVSNLIRTSDDYIHAFFTDIADNYGLWGSSVFIRKYCGNIENGISAIGESGYSGQSGWSGISGQSGHIGISGQSGWSGMGYSGYSGTPGEASESGYSGFSGISGWSGESGQSGESGVSGQSGESGISGWSGDSGISGQSGISGISGQSGWSGVSGQSGHSGISGESGISGWSGISGHSGASGESGQSGWSSYSGLSGQSGWSGTPGSVEWSGQSGFSGYSGVSGQSGVSGHSGLSGESGVSGWSGEIGPQGADIYSGPEEPSGFVNGDLWWDTDDIEGDPIILSGVFIDTEKDWSGYGISNLGNLSFSGASTVDGVDISAHVANVTTAHLPIQTSSSGNSLYTDGSTASWVKPILSRMGIDASKDWSGYAISNVGDITSVSTIEGSKFKATYSPTPLPLTMDNYMVGNDAYIADGNIQDSIVVRGATNIQNGGIVFGWNRDTNIYRSTNDTLKTDDSLIVSNTLSTGVNGVFAGTALACWNGRGPGYYQTTFGDATNQYRHAITTAHSSTVNADNKINFLVHNTLDGGLPTLVGMSINGSGLLQILPNLDSTVSTSGLQFGTDTKLYRSGGTALTTNASFNCGAINSTGVVSTAGVNISGTNNLRFYGGPAINSPDAGNLTVNVATGYSIYNKVNAVSYLTVNSSGITVNGAIGCGAITSTGRITVASGVGNGFLVGANSKIVDVASANALSVQGMSNTHAGYIYLGDYGQTSFWFDGTNGGIGFGGDTPACNVYRNGTSSLKTDCKWSFPSHVMCSVTLGTQGIPTNATTLVQFNTEVFDPNGGFNNTATPNPTYAYDFIVPVDGYYMVNAQVNWSATLNAFNQWAYLFVNGVNRRTGISQASAMTGAITHINGVIYLTAGQAVQLYVMHGYGSSTVIGPQTFLDIHLLSKS